MAYNPDIHHRRSIRLKGYDYSLVGFYFITICTQNRLHLFGEIQNGIMILNDAGKMVETVWNEIPQYYDGFAIHNFIVMPNHFHGIIEIVKIVGITVGIGVGAGPRACPYPDFRSEIDFAQPRDGQPRGGCPNNDHTRYRSSV